MKSYPNNWTIAIPMANEECDVHAFVKQLSNSKVARSISWWIRCPRTKGGSLLARLLLGVRFVDMTSGYQAFRRDVLIRLMEVPLLSKAHFYQTEVRYLLRKEKAIEVPIHYRAPSPRVSRNAIRNSFAVLGHYAFLRLTGRAANL